MVTKTRDIKNIKKYADIDEVNILTDRVKRLKKRCDEAISHVCSERSRLITESWKETEGEPLDIRRAKLFRRVLQGISIVIRDDELLVGSQTKYVRGASPALDWSSEIEVFNGTITGSDTPTRYNSYPRMMVLQGTKYNIHDINISGFIGISSFGYLDEVIFNNLIVNSTLGFRFESLENA